MDKMLELDPVQIHSVYKEYSKERVSAEELEDFLRKAPPLIRRESLIEMYSINRDTGKERRICGQPRNKKLPTFVPEGICNPHNVIDPRRQYVCCSPAGRGTDHVGIGPCKKHSFLSYYSDRGYQFGRRYSFRSHFKDLLQDHYMNGRDMPDSVISGRDAMVALQDGLGGDPLKTKSSISFDGYLQKAMEEVSPEDLVDSLRLLYEMEAHRMMLKDEQEELGILDPERIEKISNNILKMAQFQATVAKRDEHLMKAKAIQAICQVFITGVLNVVNEEIGSDQAISILQRIKDDVVLPVNERGYTEMLRRQEAAGMSRVAEKIAIEADEAQDVEIK